MREVWLETNHYFYVLATVFDDYISRGPACIKQIIFRSRRAINDFDWIAYLTMKILASLQYLFRWT